MAGARLRRVKCGFDCWIQMIPLGLQGGRTVSRVKHTTGHPRGMTAERSQSLSQSLGKKICCHAVINRSPHHHRTNLRKCGLSGALSTPMCIHSSTDLKLGDDVPDDERETVDASDPSDGDVWIDGRILGGTITSLGDGSLPMTVISAGDEAAKYCFLLALSWATGAT